MVDVQLVIFLLKINENDRPEGVLDTRGLSWYMNLVVFRQSSVVFLLLLLLLAKVLTLLLGWKNMVWFYQKKSV